MLLRPGSLALGPTAVSPQGDGLFLLSSPAERSVDFLPDRPFGCDCSGDRRPVRFSRARWKAETRGTVSRSSQSEERLRPSAQGTTFRTQFVAKPGMSGLTSFALRRSSR
jgi:hypothetical protein